MVLKIILAVIAYMAIGGVIRAFVIIADSSKSSFDQLIDDPEDALENFVFVTLWPFFTMCFIPVFTAKLISRAAQVFATLIYGLAKAFLSNGTGEDD
ncbi:MAG: hypothetical protein IKO76_06660 [Butyrivibrio sp.]|nr:hypothetical protein [Butyrivibrio sp.]